MSRKVIRMSDLEAFRTPNRATMLAAALAEHEGHTIARVVIDKAVKGDAVAARFVIGHLTPRPRGRPIALAMPGGARAGGHRRSVQRDAAGDGGGRDHPRRGADRHK